MRIPLILMIAIVFLSAAVQGQTVKTTEGHRVFALRLQINNLDVLINEAQSKIDTLLVRYSERYSAVEKARAEQEVLKTFKTKLEGEIASLTKKPLVQKVPARTDDLLKIIVVQNDRLLHLLTILVSRSSDSTKVEPTLEPAPKP